jgi:hypothetical protein
MSLISQPGSDYQAAHLTLDAGNARDIMLLLLDVHAVLDHLHLDGTQPQITAPAEDYLRESASPYTLPALIGALNDVITMLTRAIRGTLPRLNEHGATPKKRNTESENYRLTNIGVVDVAAATPWRVKIGGGCPQTPAMLGAAEPA